ncbi:hypothetical protein ACMBCN_02150 [Candidatus Liberibacter asiaticus]|nr:hypothetical protein [Candidatus Liberibacter asiaticus]
MAFLNSLFIFFLVCYLIVSFIYFSFNGRLSILLAIFIFLWLVEPPLFIYLIGNLFFLLLYSWLCRLILLIYFLVN